MPTVTQKQVWDYRQGCYVTVTDVIDPVNGSSRLSGYFAAPLAIQLCDAARRKMKETR